MSLSASAKRVFERLGVSATYKRTTKGAYDPVSGSYGPGETITHAIKVAPPSAYELDYIDGTLIQRGDAQVEIAADSLPFAPALSSSDTADALVIAGTEYQLIHVEPRYARDAVAVYTVQVRG